MNKVLQEKIKEYQDYLIMHLRWNRETHYINGLDERLQHGLQVEYRAYIEALTAFNDIFVEEE